MASWGIMVCSGRQSWAISNSIFARPAAICSARFFIWGAVKERSEIWPVPPTMGSRITGDINVRPSTRMSIFRPTFAAVKFANWPCEVGVILNETTGSPER